MKRLLIIALIVLSGLVAWKIVSSRHRDFPLQNDWRSFLWADQAGYYIYLPAHFIYHWDPATVPAEYEAGTGLGFHLDTLHHTIQTKYSIGTALMQSPFFLLAHAYTWLTGGELSGFSAPYINSIMIAGIVWGCLGLFWLYGFLEKRVGMGIALFTIGGLWLGTGLIYYHSENSGMSHIYSFALFALLLNYLDRIHTFSIGKAFVSGWVIALIILVRPTGIIGALSIILLLLPEKWVVWKEALRKPLMLFAAGLAFLCILFPQLMYWKYASGSWFNYSYGNESFSNIWHPEIVKFWFSPNNGLLPYGPLWVLIALSLGIGAWKGKYPARLGLILFVGISYLFSSWHIWFFGCGFGSRNLVEYLVVFALPFAEWMQSVFAKKRLVVKSGLILLVAGFSVLSLKLFNSYTKCFFGRDDWDWKEYSYLLLRHSIDFELPEPILIKPDNEYTQLVRMKQSDYTRTYFKEMKAEWSILRGEQACEGVLMVLQSEKGIGDPYYAEQSICTDTDHSGKAYFGMWPQQADSTEWVLYVWNPGRKLLVLQGGQARFR